MARGNGRNHVVLKIEQVDVGAEPVSVQTRQLLITQLTTAGLSVLDENLVVEPLATDGTVARWPAQHLRRCARRG